jgi:hypothetical protein
VNLVNMAAKFGDPGVSRWQYRRLGQVR